MSAIEIENKETASAEHIICMTSLAELMQKFPSLTGFVIIEDIKTRNTYTAGCLGDPAASLVTYIYRAARDSSINTQEAGDAN